MDTTAQRLGKYTLGRRLAVGGMGELYLASVDAPEGMREVAVKLLLPHLTEDPQYVQMFLDEARTVARMSHPNIVRVLDVGHAQDRYYLAMERVQGVSLMELMNALGAKDLRPSAEVLAYVGQKLCAALHHAHELSGPEGPMRLVHLAVTPHNLLVTTQGEVKLIDFGIAKDVSSSHLTPTGHLRGKRAYLAPEQILYGPLDRRTDVYSAGVTLFHFATLVKPFQRRTSSETWRAILDEALPALADLRPELAGPLSDAVRRAIQKRPEDRFGTAEAFGEALPASGLDLETGAAELGFLVRTLCAVPAPAAQRTATEHLTADLDPPPEGTASQVTDVPTGPIQVAVHHFAPVSFSSVRPPQRRSRVSRRQLAWVAGLAVLSFWGTGQVLRAALSKEPSVVALPSEPAREEILSRLVDPPDEAPLPPVPMQLGLNLREELAAAAPPKKAPNVPRRPRGQGFVNVDARPWAQVEINGQPVGETPLDRVAVASGSVLITLRNPDSGRSLTKHVTVNAGKVTYLKADLR